MRWIAKPMEIGPDDSEKNHPLNHYLGVVRDMMDTDSDYTDDKKY